MAKYTYGIWLISLWVLQGALRTTGETPPPPAYSVDPPSYNEGKALPSYDEALSDSNGRPFSSGVFYAGSEVANDDEVGLLEYGDQYAFPVDTLNLPDVLAPVIELLRLPQVISLDRNNRTEKEEELIVESEAVFGQYLSRVQDSKVYESLRKLLQTGPLDKMIQLIYCFDWQFFVPTQQFDSTGRTDTKAFITKKIIPIPDLEDDDIRLQFLSPLLVYEGRSGLAVDIAHARWQSLADGFNLGEGEADKIAEVTGFMILTDCIRAAILVNDVIALDEFLLLDAAIQNENSVRALEARTWDALEMLGLFLMALQWKRYEAAALLRPAVKPTIPNELEASSIAKRALDWFDRQGYQNPLDPLDFVNLLAPFPKHILGQPGDYTFTNESQPKDLYYMVTDPTLFTQEDALKKYRKLVNGPAPAPWAKPVSQLNYSSYLTTTTTTSTSTARHPSALAGSSGLGNRMNLTPNSSDPATMGPFTSVSTTTPPTLPVVTQSKQPQWLIDLQLARAARAQAALVSSSSSNGPKPVSDGVEPPRPANLPNPAGGSVQDRIQHWNNIAPN